MNLANASKICRICCNQTSIDLISLLNEENKTIVKKLRACADITIEHDDLLPKYICKKCFQNLNSAYSFKIQCEYMDQKFRDTITSSLQKHSDLNSKTEVGNDYSSYDEHFSNVDFTSSFELDSGQTTMDDVETLIKEELEKPDPSMNNNFHILTQQNPNHQVSNSQLTAFSKQNLDVSAMDISPRTVDSFGSMPSAKGHDDFMDQDMLSLKSEKIVAPKFKRNFKCETCGATFMAHAEYHQHKTTHGNNRFQCSVCNRWFAKKYKLNEHLKTHNGIKAFECSLCQKRYSTQTNLDRHIRVSHKKLQPHTCITCKKTFAQLSTLRLHQSVHVNEREFNCEVCKTKFKSEVQLKLHKKRHMLTEHRPKRNHSPPTAPLAPRKTFKPTQKPCVCSECGKLFGNIALLRSHLQCHSAEKKYECEFCKKRFSFQSTLRNHIYLHTGEKRFKCDVCNVSFRQIGHLQGHKLMHSGVRAFKCTHCGKAFALRSNLTVHLRTHTGNTPYHCSICPKKFSDSNGLKRHHLMHQRKNETNPIIEQILEAPIVEAPPAPAPVLKPSVIQVPTNKAPINQAPTNQTPLAFVPYIEPTFGNVSAYNVINPSTIQIIQPTGVNGDAKEFFFKIE